jgi:hypothetical protein
LGRQPLLFRETFRNQASVEENGATLVGTGTTFTGDGVTFNGSGNLLYAINGPELLKKTFTVEFDFTFGFATNEGVDRMFFDTGDAAGDGRICLYRPATNDLMIIVCGVTLLSLPHATWGPLVVAGKNTFVFTSIDSGGTYLWINGTLAGSSVTAWALFSNKLSKATQLYIGSQAWNTIRVIGTFHRFEIYGSVATAVDEPKLRAGTLVEDISIDEALVCLPGTSMYARPSTTNLLVDGNMEAVGVAAWSVSGNPTVTKELLNPHSGSQCLRVAYNGTVLPAAYQTVMTVGRRYRARGWARGDGGAAFPSVLEGAGLVLWTGSTSNSWQYFDVVFTATAGWLWLLTYAVADGYVEWDDLTLNLMETVTEVIGKAGITEALMGTTGLVTTEFPGIVRPRGFSFDGGDQINLGDNDQFSFTNGVNDLPYTVGCLARMTNNTPSKTLFSKMRSTAGNVGEWAFFLYITRQLFLLQVDETLGGWIGRVATITVNPGVWYVWIATSSGAGVTGMKIYENGIRIDTTNNNNGSYTCMRNTNDPVKIGVIAAADSPMLGDIVLPFVFDYELSPLQIRALSARMLRQSRTA